MRWARATVRGALGRAIERLDRDEWRLIFPSENGTHTEATARGRRFHNTDRFAGFLRKIIDGIEGDVLLFVDQDGIQRRLEVVATADELAAAVAKIPRTTDSVLSVTARHRGDRAVGHPDAFRIAFAPSMRLDPINGTAPMVVTVFDAGSPVRSPYELTQAVDAYTVPMSRREKRDNTSFIRPVTSSDVEQQEHESQLASRAARVGIWAGGLSGLLGGVGGAIVVEIFKK